MSEIRKNISQEVFDQLVNWLSKEYPIEDAINQLENAKIEYEDSDIIKITYDNGVSDRVQLRQQIIYEVVHLSNSVIGN